MMIRRVISVCCLLLFSAFAPPADQQSVIKKKDQQLKQLRSEIEKYEREIQQSEKKEKVTLDRLDKIEQKGNLLLKLLNELRDEESLIKNSIDSTQQRISKLERQLSALRSHYAHYVVSVYKYGKVYDFETILSSNSINQLYIRIEYLKRFSAQRKKDLDRITQKKDQIEIEHSTLQEKLSTEQQLISEKLKEENSLNRTKAKRKRALRAIRSDKSQFQKELKRRVVAAKQLENLIATLVEQERIRKEQEERERQERIAKELAAKKEQERLARIERLRQLAVLIQQKDSTKIREKRQEIADADRKASQEEQKILTENKSLEDEPASLWKQKGKLIWPVTGGKVVAEFGNHVHPILKTITTNTGIDIATKDETPVRSVAAGEIALIHWLPTYGNLIIINHSHGFRTVYAHLDEINVVVGQKVQEGQVIARSGDSVSGDMLHFELWNQKEKQNPRDWLARR